MISLGLNMVRNSWCDVSQQNILIHIKGLLFLDILMQDSHVLYFWFPMPSKDNPVKLNVLKTLEKGPNKSTLCNCFEVLSKFSGVLLCGSDSLSNYRTCMIYESYGLLLLLLISRDWPPDSYFCHPHGWKIESQSCGLFRPFWVDCGWIIESIKGRCMWLLYH